MPRSCRWCSPRRPRRRRSPSAQGHVTTPKEFFGHNIGDDYCLPNYDQFMAYWHKIDGESNRMQVVEIGKSSEGRPQLAAIITAPENFKNLAHYKEISMRLAKGEGLTDAQAHALAKEGKAVVWFDGGLHATEVLGANQLIETTYQLLTRTTRRRCASSRTTSSSPCTRIPTACSSSRTGT